MPAYTREMARTARLANIGAFLMERHPDEIVVENSSAHLKANYSIAVGNGFSGYRDFATDETGNAVDLLTRHLGYSVADAVRALAEFEAGRAGEANPETFATHQLPKSELSAGARANGTVRGVVLPEREPGPFRRVFAYLGARGIPAETVRSLIDRGLLYQERERGNAVFASEAGDFAETRGTLTYGGPFHQTLKAAPDRYWAVTAGEGEPETAYVCEGAIDAVSLMVMRERAGATEPAAYCGIGGVANESAIAAIAAKYPRVVLAVDSDRAGDAARERHPELEAIVPRGKDFNDDLANGDCENNRKREKEEMALNERQARTEGDAMESVWAEADSSIEVMRIDPSTNVHEDRVDTGFARLDELLGGGLLAPGLHVIGALPSLGKTTFVMQLAENVSASGRQVIVFSLETSRMNLAAKSVSREMRSLDRSTAETPSEILSGKRDADPKGERWAAVKRARDAVAARNANMRVFEPGQKPGGWTVEDVDGLIGWYVETKKPSQSPFVVVDYLQILRTSNDSGFLTDKARIDRVVGGLRGVATKYGVAVLVISSFSRSNYDADPDLSAFKESGQIEYDAETAMALVYPGAGKKDFSIEAARSKAIRDVDLKVLKSKNGEAGVRVHYTFDAAYATFSEKKTRRSMDDDDWDD